MELSDIYKPISKKLNEVESKLREELHSSNELLSKIGTYTLDTPCKRIRPAIVLMSANLSGDDHSNGGENNQYAIKLACAIELIHTASLIHNDIIDGATLRRGRGTINSIWGNRNSMLFGDYLFQKAFSLLLQVDSREVLSIISRATSMMCEGEIDEIKNLFNSNLTQEFYLEIVKKKTASFFSCCCEIGALVGSANSREVSALSAYGLNIGMAFQITDDCLDLIGEERNLGKTTGMDIKNGKMTLPLLRLFSTVSRREKDKLMNNMRSGNKESIMKLKEMIIACGAIDYSFTVAKSYVAEAKKVIEIVNSSILRRCLDNLCEYVVERNY